MKLIVRDFLKSLKEDGELDALLVDLLSEMGLSIQGTPQKGVAQNGVDLWAVGKIPPDEDNRIYLVSVKCGNLKRDNWDVGKQALRPSLNQIIDTFIKHYIPKPLMSLKKCVCVAVGGEVNPNVQQTVNDHLEYLRTSYDVDARILSGDEIAGLVCDHLLGATVLRGAGQRILFQALAMVQEPEASLRSFRQLLALLFEKEPKSFSEWTRQARAGILSLALLDSYCQEANNLEASCLGSEFFLLSLGEFVQHATSLSGFSAEMIDSVLRSAEKLSREIQKRYFEKFSPLVHGKYHLSLSVPDNEPITTNLRLYDLLGRAASFGLSFIDCQQKSDGNEIADEEALKPSETVERMGRFVHEMIKNNPTLLYPVRDDFCIEVSLAAQLLVVTRDIKFLHWWLGHIVDNLHSCLSVGTPFLCVFTDHRRLAEFCHTPKAFKTDALPSSEMIPMIAIITLALGFFDIYSQLCDLVRTHLPTTNLQLWYPDNTGDKQKSERDAPQGKQLVSLPLDDPKRLLEMVRRECKESPFLPSALFPWSVFSSCRLYRIPIPVHYWSPLLEIIPDDRLSTIFPRQIQSLSDECLMSPLPYHARRG